MRPCLNGATTMPYSLEEDIRAAAAAEFAAIEIWHPKLVTYLQDHAVGDLRRLLQDNRLAAAAICPLTCAYGEEAEVERTTLARAAEVAAALDCPMLLVCLEQPPPGLATEPALEQAVEEVARAADLAARWGVKLAIEPLGRHPLVAGPKEALTIIERAGRSNVGLMLDTFHYYKSEVPLTDIAALPLDKLLIVHVNDCEDRPREELRDAHRLYPTLGVIPAAAMLRPLAAGGYSGDVSVEIFRPEYWAQPVEVITRQAKYYLDQLLACLSS